MHHIPRIFVLALRLLLPATGLHRKARQCLKARNAAPTVPVPGAPAPNRRYPFTRPYVPGSHTGLIHPYFDPAPWPRPAEERRLQRQRRRTLWLAVHGIDVPPELIHGVKVGTRR